MLHGLGGLWTTAMKFEAADILIFRISYTVCGLRRYITFPQGFGTKANHAHL
jgi:hypothetical protein